jgi:hypothetical protein
MMDIDDLKVSHFATNRVPNPYPGGQLPWQVYHTVRNAMVRTCRRFGPTGPLGECAIIEGRECLDVNCWEHGDPSPIYYIIDDQYNDEQYLYAELVGEEAFNAAWLAAITATLREHKGWGIGIRSFPDSYILIFGNRLMVNGKLSRCKTATEVIAKARRLLKRGAKKWWPFWK